VIVGAEDVSTCKPSPEPYLTAAAGLGVDPRLCLAIEDSLPGLQAARTAGLATIAVTSTSPAHVLEKAADKVVAGLHELSPDMLADVGALRAL
jgi:sugar-phosphatase